MVDHQIAIASLYTLLIGIPAVVSKQMSHRVCRIDQRELFDSPCGYQVSLCSFSEDKFDRSAPIDGTTTRLRNFTFASWSLAITSHIMHKHFDCLSWWCCEIYVLLTRHVPDRLGDGLPHRSYWSAIFKP